MDIISEIQSLKDGENVIVRVDDEVRDTMALLIFQQSTLEMQLNSIRDNKYGFYNRDVINKLLIRIEDKNEERMNFINNIGRELIGDNFREILNKYGVEFIIEQDLPIVRFFKKDF